jgi:hypothetical protein
VTVVIDHIHAQDHITSERSHFEFDLRQGRAIACAPIAKAHPLSISTEAFRLVKIQTKRVALQAVLPGGETIWRVDATSTCGGAGFVRKPTLAS